jgi:hypothetical protein
MGNHILTEKQKEENCDHLFQKLKSSIGGRRPGSGELIISFPNSGVGFLNCNKFNSYNDYVKTTGKNVSVYQTTNCITKKQLIEYNITDSNINVILEDELHFFFC